MKPQSNTSIYILLKSPHVNKTAQEQFKKQIYLKNLRRYIYI